MSQNVMLRRIRACACARSLKYLSRRVSAITPGMLSMLRILIGIFLILILVQFVCLFLSSLITYKYKKSDLQFEEFLQLFQPLTTSSLNPSPVHTRRRNLPSKPKVILFGSEWFFGRFPYLNETLTRCPQCLFTHDGSMYDAADAVVFHGVSMRKKNGLRPPNQVWVWFYIEAPSYIERRHERWMNYTNLINWTMTYRKDSDIYVPYGRVHSKHQMARPDFSQKWAFLPNEITHGNEYYDESMWEIPTVEELRGRKMVAWITSNCKSQSKREQAVKELAKYVQVDTYGNCGQYQCRYTRKDRTESGNLGINCRLDFGKKYKFYLAFENSLCEDYVTEKYFDTLFTQMIPIVYGATNYKEFAPKFSYIDVADFKNIKELADYLIYLDTHPYEHLKYFAWRKDFWVQNNGYVDGYCDLCAKVWRIGMEEPKSYPSINDWWFRRSDYNVSGAMACLIPHKFNISKKITYNVH